MSESFSQLLKSTLNFKKKIILIADVFPNLRTPKNVVRSMSKISHCRRAFEKKHRKHVQTLLKSQQQHHYHIYWSLLGQLSCKKPLFVIWKILRQFVNTETALIADVFPKLWTLKNVVKSISKMSRFRGPFEKQHGIRAQTLLKSQRQHVYLISWSLCRELRFNPLLGIHKILNFFVNRLTADDKYSLLNRDNITQPIQMQLSQKRKTFSWFFSSFLNSSLNFEHSQKQDYPHSSFISGITDSVKEVRSMPYKSRKKGSFEKKHGIRSQTLLKS